jgi:hypothetical protein
MAKGADQTAPGTLAALNVFSTAPERSAAALSALTGVPFRRADRDDGPHFSGVLSGLIVSVHPGDAAAVELGVIVGDLDATVGACLGHGAELLSGPEHLAYGDSAHLQAPGGFRVELVRPPAT